MSMLLDRVDIDFDSIRHKHCLIPGGVLKGDSRRKLTLKNKCACNVSVMLGKAGRSLASRSAAPDWEELKQYRTAQFSAYFADG